MIRYLLGKEYMGLHVGPEPTTDRYVAIVHGDTDDVIQVCVGVCMCVYMCLLPFYPNILTTSPKNTTTHARTQGKVLTENPNLPFKETESFAGLAGKFQAAVSACVLGCWCIHVLSVSASECEGCGCLT
jgi:hypothetical protein